MCCELIWLEISLCVGVDQFVRTQITLHECFKDLDHLSFLQKRIRNAKKKKKKTFSPFLNNKIRNTKAPPPTFFQWSQIKLSLSYLALQILEIWCLWGLLELFLTRIGLSMRILNKYAGLVSFFLTTSCFCTRCLSSILTDASLNSSSLFFSSSLCSPSWASFPVKRDFFIPTVARCWYRAIVPLSSLKLCIGANQWL